MYTYFSYTHIFLFMLLLDGSMVFSQIQGSSPVSIMDVIDPNRLNQELNFDRRYPKIDGSPFITKDWATGTIIREQGSPLEGLQLHFDLYKQELLIKQENNIVATLPKSVKAFRLYQLDGSKLYFTRNPLIDKTAFIQALYQGNHEIWKRYEVSLSRQENLSGGYGKTGNASEIQRFNRAETWYLIRPEGEKAEIFIPSKKELLGLFPNRSDEIKRYLKKNKIKLTKDLDWIKLMQFLEEK